MSVRVTAELAIAIGAISHRTGIHPLNVVPLALEDLETAPDVRRTVMEIEALWGDGEMLAGRPYPLEAMNDLLPYIAVARLASNAGIGAAVH
ncbi:MAG: hypothetical protein AAFY66_10045 [Pseudomonadota bacterium]